MLVGIHFWLAMAGILVYIVALWLGGAAQGRAWMQGLPFMDSVRVVIPHMVWRVVAGFLMLGAHVVFCINLFKMRPGAFTMAFSGEEEAQLPANG